MLKDQHRFSIPHRIAIRLNISRDFPQQIEQIDMNTWLSLTDHDFEQLITTDPLSQSHTWTHDHENPP